MALDASSTADTLSPLLFDIGGVIADTFEKKYR